MPFSIGVRHPRGGRYSDTQGYTSRLPSARKISRALFQSKNESDGDRTHMLMQYGQFIDHDVSRTTKEGLSAKTQPSKILFAFMVPIVTFAENYLLCHVVLT